MLVPGRSQSRRGGSSARSSSSQEGRVSTADPFHRIETVTLRSNDTASQSSRREIPIGHIEVRPMKRQKSDQGEHTGSTGTAEEGAEPQGDGGKGKGKREENAGRDLPEAMGGTMVDR